MEIKPLYKRAIELIFEKHRDKFNEGFEQWLKDNWEIYLEFEMQACAKKQIQEETEKIRLEVYDVLFKLNKIPDKVLNGSLQEIQEYKTYCEQAGKSYHVQNKAGNRNSIGQLLAIGVKLIKIKENVLNG